jgi:LacI family transcriptional regulator
MVTLKDIAEKAGLTAASVSLALNGRPGVSDQTRERVRRIADEMEYVPNAIAQNLSRRSAKCVGLILPDLSNPFFACFAEFVNRNLESAGYSLMVSMSNQIIANEKRAVKELIGKRVDGIIIVPVTDEIGKIPYTELLEKSGTPFIFATAYYPKYMKGYVMTDLSDGERLAVEYLIDSGHRRILFLGTNENSPSNFTRISGARIACANRNLKSRDVLDVRRLPLPTFDAAYEYIRDMSDSDIDFTAVAAINDMTALGAMKALTERGLRIPDDVSVIGYDNLLFSELSTVSLSTVSQNTHEIARICVEKIMEHKTDERIIIKPKLIIRSSTGERRGDKI